MGLGDSKSLESELSSDKKYNYHVEQRYAGKREGTGPISWFWKASYKIDSWGEARGIDIQPPYLRGKGDFKQFFRESLIWLGACGSLSSMTGFFTGPLLFNLSFKDSVSAGLAGAFVGSLVAGYGALMGPRSGLRQMVGTRFQFGWWPAKFIALLNVLTLLGWSVISLVLSGQMLEAISNNKVPLEVGIIILFVVSVTVAMFGINYVTLFDKIFVFPALICFLLVYVCTGPEWAVNSKSIGETSGEIVANWFSFFGACIGITSTWIALASDYYVDFPVDTNPVKLYIYAVVMVFIPTIFIGFPGIGIASAARFTNEKWANAYETGSTGGLLAEAMSKWNGGGKFIVVMMFISLITNNILNTYSIPLSAQVFGRIWTRIPRYILCFVVGCIYLILASVGRSKFAEIISSFLPMIGYWSMIYAMIMIIETAIFRRGRTNEYQWEFWNDPSHFPVMYAAVFSYCVGVAGAVVGMSQAYFVGPLSEVCGKADIGNEIAVGVTVVTYLPARWIELKLRTERPIRP